MADSMTAVHPTSQVLKTVAAEVAVAAREGVEVAIVVGGGNYFRGINAWDGLDRATADHMGMLATCMNAICLQVMAMCITNLFGTNISGPVASFCNLSALEKQCSEIGS